MTSPNFKVTQVVTTQASSGVAMGWNPLVYASNKYDFEWGACASDQTVSLANFPIWDQQASMGAEVQTLFVALLTGQFQIYYNTSDSSASIVAKVHTGDSIPFTVHNQISLWSGPIADASFSLHIDMTKPPVDISKITAVDAAGEGKIASMFGFKLVAN